MIRKVNLEAINRLKLLKIKMIKELVKEIIESELELLEIKVKLKLLEKEKLVRLI